MVVVVAFFLLPRTLPGGWNMTDETSSHAEAGSFSPSGMGRIGIELLTKATLCAAVIGFLAMMAVALLSSL